MYRLSFLVAIIFMLSSCFTARKSPSSETTLFIRGDTVQIKLDYQLEAEKRYALEPVEYLISPQGNYMLCFSEKAGTALFPQSFTRYMVYNLAKGRVIYEGTVDNGSIQWADETHLEIYQRPGIMANGQTADDYTFLINILTREKKAKIK